VGLCLRALPQVFDTGRRPWVDLEGADADAIADAVERCPTGALLYERLDDAPGDEPRRPTIALPIPNGPILMAGDLVVETPDGEEIAHENRLALCRCGLSRNQPFCDNSHMRRRWESGAVGPPADACPAPRDGAAEEPTRIVPLENGSLKVTGHVVMHDAETGEQLAEFGRAFLCRCGHSDNKPFCDTSHKRVDFQSRPPQVERDRLEAETPAAFTPNPRVAGVAEDVEG
jgi:CDGSH-type Zn-finger protein